ncbi:MAG TPA: hypothetical protein VM285_05330 [Polyangia bacterium]|nr:hypothetical protein [Polyangia bacterium]
MERRHTRSRELISTDEHLALSAAINYQVEANHPNRSAILALILDRPAPEPQRGILLQALEVILAGYGDEKRKVRGRSVIHPIRTAAIVARATDEPTTLHMLSALLHDRDEDLGSVPEDRAERYSRACERLGALVSQEENWFLGERIDFLTRKEGRHYMDYLAGILGHAGTMIDLLHTKCADRLDNTLDHGLQPGVAQLNWFRAVHDALFVPAWRGVELEEYHRLPGAEEGEGILSMLFKNTIFLSMARRSEVARADATTVRLLDALAVASIRVAGWIALATLASGNPPVARHREFLLDVMGYVHGGGLAVRRKDEDGDLDGVLLDYWQNDSTQRREKMSALFSDRERLLKLCCLFVVSFASFLNDPLYSVPGVDIQNLKPGR